MVAKSGLLIAAVIALAFSATAHAPTTPMSQRDLPFAVQTHGAEENAVDYAALRREADTALEALIGKDAATQQRSGQAS